MQVKTIFWVCRVEEPNFTADILNELRTETKPPLHFEPEIWFSSEFDALKWIQENEGSWTIVKVFETT